jgi:hypothetical protein
MGAYQLQSMNMQSLQCIRDGPIKIRHVNEKLSTKQFKLSICHRNMWGEWDCLVIETCEMCLCLVQYD